MEDSAHLGARQSRWCFESIAGWPVCKSSSQGTRLSPKVLDEAFGLWADAIKFRQQYDAFLLVGIGTSNDRNAAFRIAWIVGQMGHFSGLACCEGKLNHLGLQDGAKRSTLSYANAKRPWQLFEQVFYGQLGVAQILAV